MGLFVQGCVIVQSSNTVMHFALYRPAPRPPPGAHKPPYRSNYCFRYGDASNPSGDSPSLQDDYIQLQPPGRQGVYGSTTGRGATGPLPPSYPTPLSRLIFRDLKLLITLNQEEDEQPSQPGLYKQLNLARITYCSAVHRYKWLVLGDCIEL